MKKYRTILAAIVIVVVVAIGYGHYLPIYQQQQQQQVQQEAIPLLKQYNAYDPNYSYSVFGSLYVNDLLSGANRTVYTATSTYLVASNNLPNVSEQLYTYSVIQGTTGGNIVCNSTEYTYTYPVGTSSTAQSLYRPAALVSYTITGGQDSYLAFAYENGPICEQGRACSFILMLIDTQSSQQFPLSDDPRYEVLNHFGTFYEAPLSLVADWRFYFLEASPA
ncbi:MAG TPA: hypothetical protein VJZ32_13025 [Candidatus Bathyarchaeia archaeon]|nr:hypothetical protein [Candidatus Bathyarchaeia archaeon]